MKKVWHNDCAQGQRNETRRNGWFAGRVSLKGILIFSIIKVLGLLVLVAVRGVRVEVWGWLKF